MAFDPAFFVFIVPVSMLLLAAYFFSGRGAMLISGYNTLPKDEREKYNIKALTQSMGIFTSVTAVLMFFILYSGVILEKTVWSLAGLIFVFIFTAVWIVYMNTNKKLKTGI
jgi:hypothetical protein